MRFPQGTISFYADGRFEAVCRLHEDCAGKGCRVTRTSKANPKRPQQGRPLGFLSAWLIAGCDLCLESHRDKFWQAHGFTKESRSAAREFLKGLPNGRELMAKERAKLDEELSEPEIQP